MYASLVTHSTKFPLPGKTYSIDSAGALHKVHVGAYVEADLRVIETGLDRLAAFIKEGAEPCHVLVAGVPSDMKPNEHCWLVADGDERVGTTMHDQVVGTRTNAFLPFPCDTGMLCIDSDGIQEVPVREQLVSAVPALAGYKAVEASSTSSNLIDATRGVRLRGEEGLHTFFHVANGRDIPRALSVLHKRLVLAGFGYVKISAAGKTMLRSAVDLALRTPSQPIYLRPQLGEGLLQDKRVTIHPGEEVLDTQIILPDLSDEEALRYSEICAELDLRALPEAQRQQREFLENRVIEAVSRGVPEPRARKSVLHVLAYETLGPEDLILLAKGATVKVSDILAAPDQYDGMVCADPLEPSYGSGVGVAKIFAKGDRPNIHSFAHGGQVFWLTEQSLSDFEPVMSLEDLEQRQLDAAQAALGDLDLKAWLAAKIVTGRDMVALTGATEMSADDLGLALSRAQIGLPGESLPAGLEVGDHGKYAGLGLRVIDRDGVRQHIFLSVDAAERFLSDWARHDRGHATRGWQFMMASSVAFPDGTDDVHVSVISRHASKVLKLTPKDARDSLVSAIQGQQQLLLQLQSRSKPSPPEDWGFKATSETNEQREERLREELQAVEAKLLDECRNIAEQPLMALSGALQASGVAGEMKAGEFCYLIITSAHFHKPASGVTRGPSGTGKSHVMKAAANLFPDECVYRISSISPKALIYEPEGFSHRTIILDEAEALVRKGDEMNPTAEMLRVLLSEGRLVHKVVEKNSNGTHETRTYIAEGPTNMLTTTTRAYLDAEVENRVIDQYSDVSPKHQKEVFAMLGTLAAGGGCQGPDLSAWHAFARWVRMGPRKVVMPVAEKLARLFRTDLAYRTFNNVLSLAAASALIHRLNRQTDSDGQLIAEIDDYRVAYNILAERINEVVEARIPEDKVELFWQANDIIERHGHIRWGQAVCELEFDGKKLSSKILETTERKFALLAGWSKTASRQRLNYLASVGLLSKDSNGPGRHSKTSLSLGPDATIILKGGRGLPTPEEVESEAEPS